MEALNERKKLSTRPSLTIGIENAIQTGFCLKAQSGYEKELIFNRFWNYVHAPDRYHLHVYRFFGKKSTFYQKLKQKENVISIENDHFRKWFRYKKIILYQVQAT